MLASICLIRKVALTTGIPVRDLVTRRPRYIVRLRQAMGMVAKNRQNISYAEYGRQVGLDHSTVMYGCQTLLAKMKKGEPEALKAYRVVIRAHLHVREELRTRRRTDKQQIAALLVQLETPDYGDDLDEMISHLYAEPSREHNKPKNLDFIARQRERQRRTVAA